METSIGTNTNLIHKRYQDIRDQLHKVATLYLKNIGIKTLQKETQRQSEQNRLIEVPNNIQEFLKNFLDIYKRDIDEIEGEIGITSNAEEQLEGITDMALLIILSNKLKNYYEHIYNKAKLDNNIDKMAQANTSISKALRWKDEALSDIIACLYIRENTYNNELSYGLRIDNDYQDSFIFDIPYIGQFCVHYGGTKNGIPNREIIINNARQKLVSILKRKKEFGKIDDIKYNELIQQANFGEILPKYQSELYQYSLIPPLEYLGPKMKKIIEKLGIKGKQYHIHESDSETDSKSKYVTDTDISLMINSGLSIEELHYLSTKLGFSSYLIKAIENEYKSKNQDKSKKASILEESREIYPEIISNIDLSQIKRELAIILDNKNIER